MGRRLFLRIYVGFVLTGLLCIAAAGVAAHVIYRGQSVPPHVRRVAELAVTTLPADDAEREAALRRWADELDVHIALLDADGMIQVATGDVPRPRMARGDQWLRGEAGPGLALRLDDGSWAVVVSRHPRAPSPERHLAALAGLAVLMALGAYPVARGITRRLEALRRGIDDLGEGDLTARVTVEGKDEVAALARSFNRSADRLQALIESQRRMLAAASHELRSPLARLRMSVELLAEGGGAGEVDGAGDAGGNDDLDRAGLLAEAVRNVEELDQLVEDLLLVGRLEARDRALDDRVELLALAAEEAARVDGEATGAAVEISGDEALLRILLRNLLENAKRHGAPPIEVSVEPANGGARITVTDAGPGVPAEERDRIFSPFHRAPGQPEGTRSGAGLGLSLVRRIAAIHGGEVRCEGEAGGRFVVLLPVGNT